MIRSAIKAGLKKVLGVEVKGPAAAPPSPAWKPSVPKPAVVRPPTAPVPTTAKAPETTPAPPAAEPVAAAPSTAAPPEVAAAPAEVVAAPAEVVAEAPKAKKGKKAKEAPAPEVDAAPPEPPAPVVEVAPPAAAKGEPADDSVGAPAFSMDQVQELLDEMVRPALQGDGGDITLIRIESNDVYVKLVGSCSSCPSSIMTMKMGVEALMREELPGFGNLIQVD